MQSATNPVSPKVLQLRDRDRIPPQNLDAEEQILGGILFDPNAFDRIAGITHPKHFYTEAHRCLFQTFLDLRAMDHPIDLMSVSTRLLQQGQMDKIGGRSRLVELLDCIIGTANIDLAAEYVADAYRRRQLIRVGQELAAIARDETLTWEQTKEAAEALFFGMMDEPNPKGAIAISDLMIEEGARLEQSAQGDDTAIASGFYDLDGMTQGFQPGQLIIIAGRPAMGKSAFASTIARSVAGRGKPTVLFSLEMSGGEIVRRLWSAEQQLHTGQMRGSILPQTWESIGHAIAAIAPMPMFVDDGENVTPAHVLSQCRRIKEQNGGLGLIIVDYLHLMLETDDETRELGKLTRTFKKMARSLGAPIILLSQLNRSVEGRTNKRPMLSDLRQSGRIEEDADTIIFLYRDEYYNPDTPDRGIAEVIVAKQRSGPVGTVRLLFEPHFSKFRNLATRP